MTDHLIAPHGGSLTDLLVGADRATELKQASREWLSWDLTPRQLCDLELLLSGGFSPLTGFMGQRDYERVLSDMRLADGALWPVPITLDIPAALAEKLTPASQLALRDAEGVMLGVLQVEDVWQPDRKAEAAALFETADDGHPSVVQLMRGINSHSVGGRLEGIQLPRHYDYRRRRKTPAAVRGELSQLGWRRVVAYQTRAPIHRPQQEFILGVAKDLQANVLIQPIVGAAAPGDIEHYTRVRCYQALLPHFPRNTVMLSLLPLAPRFAGPREAVWQALIAKNHGCTHVIVDGDRLGPGGASSAAAARSTRAAFRLVEQHREELGVSCVPLRTLVYLRDEDRYVPEDEVPEGALALSISDAELRERLADGREIPEWFTHPEVAAQLRRTHPPRHRQGFTVFFTGLSGSGKSTMANVLLTKFLEMGGRPVTLLDGDIVRKHLSSELGFTRAHRDLNIHRIGFVASEITKNGGIAICAPIAPYDSVRKENRAMIERGGGYILVHVATPLEVCEQRDRKGLYAKARAGIVKEFTGISDPYEEPDDADVVIDTSNLTPEEAAQQIILYLEKRGYIAANGG